jgi:hypothetical protein
MAISFLLILVPVQGVFNYMGWPVFNGAGMHAGAWVFPLPFVSGIVYYFLIRIEQRWFNLFDAPRSVCLCLTNVFFIEIRICAENLGIGMTGRDLAHNCPDGDAHAAKARFATHDFGIASDTIKVRHTIVSLELYSLSRNNCASFVWQPILAAAGFKLPLFVTGT